MVAAAASASSAHQPLKVELSASATEACCSRKSGKKSVFRRLTPKCLESCLPIAPAPAAKTPSPQVGSPNFCCHAAWQRCAVCILSISMAQHCAHNGSKYAWGWVSDAPLWLHIAGSMAAWHRAWGCGLYPHGCRAGLHALPDRQPRLLAPAWLQVGLHAQSDSRGGTEAWLCQGAALACTPCLYRHLGT